MIKKDSALRVFLPLMTAPLAAAILVCAYSGTIKLFPTVFVIALPHALFLGLPFYWMCKGNGWTRWQHSLIAGFVIGNLPLSFIMMTTGYKAGLLEFLQNLFFPLGIIGAIGGISAWAVWRKLIPASP